MAPSARKAIKILCVDDEPELLEGLVRTISKGGLEVLTAANGRLALEIIHREGERMAAVISDAKMPELDGFGLRREMLSEHKQIPFIMISAFVSREEALCAVELKISAFVAKPFSANELQDIVVGESAERVAFIREEDDLLEGFIQEASNLVEEMEALLLGLDDNLGDSSALNRIFACAHTIKGTSAFFKPETVHKFTHQYEDYLSQFRKDPFALGPAEIGILLGGLDVLRTLISELGRGEKSSRTLAELTAPFVAKSPEKKAAHPAPSEAAPTATATTSSPAPSPAPSHDELRVGVGLLNQFMERNGELTVLRNMVNKVVRVIEADRPGDPNIAALSDLLGEMHKVNGFIQDQVTDLRKIPLKQIFKPLSRTLRDLCAMLGKQVKLDTEGDDLRVDHTLAEVLSKVLVHMVRNSADHGIEMPEARVAAGKPATGLLRLSAREESDSVVIRVVDDGRGVDPIKVRAKALEKGIITAAAAESMTESELRMLIFAPGFSTAEQVTGVSGRGVGTDMVMGSVRGIGGSVELGSTVGKGTEFILRLPIPKSVLIIDSLMVRVSGRIVAIPRDDVVRVIAVGTETEQRRLNSVGKSRVYRDQHRLLPVLSLRSILKIDGPPASQSGALVHVHAKGVDYCLEVDEVLDIEDTVVKNAGPWLKALPAYLGATFLADGRIGLILSTSGIAFQEGLREASEKKAAETGPASPPSVGEAVTEKVLLFRLKGSAALFGARQAEVFRLEEFPRARVQRSGGSPVVVYRGHAMPLHDLRTLTGLPTSAEDAAEGLQVIVVRRADRHLGLVVGSVVDFGELTSGAAERFHAGESSGQETVILKDSTGERAVTVLDLRVLVP